VDTFSFCPRFVDVFKKSPKITKRPPLLFYSFLYKLNVNKIFCVVDTVVDT